MQVQTIPVRRVIHWYYQIYLKIGKCSDKFTSIAYHENGKWKILYNIYRSKSEVINNNTSDSNILQEIATGKIKLSINYILMIHHEDKSNPSDVYNHIKNRDEGSLEEEYTDKITLKYVNSNNIMIIIVYDPKNHTEQTVLNHPFIACMNEIFGLLHYYPTKDTSQSFVQDITKMINGTKMAFILVYQMHYIPSGGYIDMGNTGEIDHITQHAIPNAIICYMYCESPTDTQYQLKWQLKDVDESCTLIVSHYKDRIWPTIGNTLKDIFNNEKSKSDCLMIRLCANMLDSHKEEYPILYMRSFKNDYKKILSVHKEKFAEYDTGEHPEWEPIPYPITEVYVLHRKWTEQWMDNLNKAFNMHLTLELVQIIVDFL